MGKHGSGATQGDAFASKAKLLNIGRPPVRERVQQINFFNMASGGHNAKSSKDHLAKGNFRPSRHADRAEDKVKILKEVPKAPAYFDLKHRKKWQEVCEKIYDLDVLTDNDLDSLETYVKYWFIGKAAWDDIQANGITVVNEKGAVSRNPSILTMNEATQITERIADKFAGNPRSRMVIKTGKQEIKADDPLEFLN